MVSATTCLSARDGRPGSAPTHGSLRYFSYPLTETIRGRLHARYTRTSTASSGANFGGRMSERLAAGDLLSLAAHAAHVLFPFGAFYLFVLFHYARFARGCLPLKKRIKNIARISGNFWQREKFA